MTFDLENEISMARTAMVSRLPFFGHLSMQMRPRAARPEDGVPTAAVGQDGTLVICAKYMESLPVEERRGLMAHEVGHPGFLFWSRLGPRNLRLMNVAHDLTINAWIEEMSTSDKTLPSIIRLPKGALLDPKFDGMAAEEIYAYLLKGDKGDGVTKVKTKGGGEITIKVEDDGSGDGDGSRGGGIGQDCRNDIGDTPDGQRANAGDSSAQNKLSADWKMQLAGAKQVHEARGQGTLPLGMQRYIEGLLHPKLDWTENLRRWAGEHGKPDDYSFARPHRWSQMVGTYLPSLCGGGHADVTILQDTSGSMSLERIRRCYSEVGAICEEYESEIRVLMCDADVTEDISIEHAVELLTKTKGGGGSDFRPAFRRLQDECYDGAVIVFTDGMISVPDEMPPGLRGVLWVLEGSEVGPAQWGDVVVIEDAPMY